MRDRVKASRHSVSHIIFFFVRRMRISTFNEGRSVSDIIKRSSPTRATSTTTASDTGHRGGRALLLLAAVVLVAEARPRAWRVRTSCRARRRDFYYIRQFLSLTFPFGLCVLDVVFLSLVHSVADCCERARLERHSRRRAGPPER